MKLLKFPNFNIHFLSLQTLQLLDFNFFLRCFLDGSRFLMEPAGILSFTFGAFRRSFILLSWEFKMLLKCFEKFSFYKAESFGCSFFKEYLQVFVPFAKSENKELWTLVNPHHTRGILLTKAPKNVVLITITAYKVPVFRVILVRVFPHSDRASLHIQSENGKMRTRITPNTDTFHVVSLFQLSFVFSDIPIMSLDF